MCEPALQKQTGHQQKNLISREVRFLAPFLITDKIVAMHSMRVRHTQMANFKYCIGGIAGCCLGNCAGYNLLPTNKYSNFRKCNCGTWGLVAYTIVRKTQMWEPKPRKSPYSARACKAKPGTGMALRQKDRSPTRRRKCSSACLLTPCGTLNRRG